MKKQTLALAPRLTSFVLLMLAASAVWADPTTLVSDPVGDFISTYAGPKNGDLDVVTTGATQDGINIVFTATVNGPVGSTANGFYVIGVDRGQGTARFGVITIGGNTYDASGVLFDSVVIYRPGTATPLAVTDLITGQATQLTAANIVVNGNSFQLTVPVSLLPSRGAALGQYTFNLWPRFGGAGVTGNAQISDFAPNNSNAPITPTPEPATVLLLGTGLVGAAWRRRTRQAQ